MDMNAVTTPAPMAETPLAAPINLETTPEFLAFKEAKLAEVKNYLDTNWGIKDAEVVMMPQYVFPDRKNRKAYASISSGQSFRDADNKIIINPATGQPMTYTVWRKIPPPSPEPAIEDAKANLEPVTPTELE